MGRRCASCRCSASRVSRIFLHREARSPLDRAAQPLPVPFRSGLPPGGRPLIATGSVLVKGERPPPGGRLVDPATDLVTVDGTEIRPPAVLTYIAANKPEGYIVSAADPGSRPTVFSLVETDARLFAVGRLDMDSRGLLLLTDDGEMAHRLAHH